MARRGARRDLLALVMLLALAVIAAKTDWIESAANAFGQHEGKRLVHVIVPSPTASPPTHARHGQGLGPRR